MLHINTEYSDNNALMSFEGEIIIDNSQKMKEAFNESLKKAEKIEIDVKKTTELDITFFQILYSAYRTSKQRSKTLMLHNSFPESLQANIQHSGFSWLIEKIKSY